MTYLANHGLFKPNAKYLKLFKDNFNVVEGVNSVVGLVLADLKIPYEQYFTTNSYLKEDTYHNEISYGSLGTQITFLAIKVIYESTVSNLSTNSEIPCLEYFFDNDVETKKTFDNLLILTGSSNRKIPKIYLNNINTKHRARIAILAATTDVTFEPAPSLNQINSNTVDIQNLSWRNIVSDDFGDSIIIQRSADDPLANISLSHISNIEMNGRIMTIDDTAQGEINLFFNDTFNALQAYSIINWAMADPSNNKISSSTDPDLTGPVINHASTFTTNITILDYPTNGTNGSDGYTITKDNLIELLVHDVTDNRDGLIYIDSANLTITKVNENIKRSVITEPGKYTLTIEVADSANNKTAEIFILDIKDADAPKIILSDLGYELYLAGTNGQATNIYLQDYSLNKIKKSDLLDILVDEIFDVEDGQIEVTTNKVSVTITGFNSNTVYNEINVPGLYDIYIQVADSHGNIGNTLWHNINTELTNSSHLILLVKENQAPDVIFNSVPDQHLYHYNGTITKVNLNNLVVDYITDDRDGIITNTILNLSVYQLANTDNSGTNGHTTIIDGTNGYDFYNINQTEVLYINEIGIYSISIIVVDSDGAIDMQDITINVLP